MALQVSKDAIIKRINRGLVNQIDPRETRKLRTARGMRMIANVGNHYIVNVSLNVVVDTHVDIEDYARAWGHMREWEQLRQDERRDDGDRGAGPRQLDVPALPGRAAERATACAPTATSAT